MSDDIGWDMEYWGKSRFRVEKSRVLKKTYNYKEALLFFFFFYRSLHIHVENTVWCFFRKSKTEIEVLMSGHKDRTEKYGTWWGTVYESRTENGMGTEKEPGKKTEIGQLMILEETGGVWYCRSHKRKSS